VWVSHCPRSLTPQGGNPPEFRGVGNLTTVRGEIKRNGGGVWVAHRLRSLMPLGGDPPLIRGGIEKINGGGGFTPPPFEKKRKGGSMKLPPPSTLSTTLEMEQRVGIPPLPCRRCRWKVPPKRRGG
jgi:hypothetical protein